MKWYIEDRDSCVLIVKLDMVHKRLLALQWNLENAPTELDRNRIISDIEADHCRAQELLSELRTRLEKGAAKPSSHEAAP